MSRNFLASPRIRCKPSSFDFLESSPGSLWHFFVLRFSTPSLPIPTSSSPCSLNGPPSPIFVLRPRPLSRCLAKTSNKLHFRCKTGLHLFWRSLSSSIHLHQALSDPTQQQAEPRPLSHLRAVLSFRGFCAFEFIDRPFSGLVGFRTPD